MIRIHLSRLLEEKDITQNKLYLRTGIRPATINALYHGTAVTLRVEHLNKLCKYFNCTLNELIDYIPD